VKKGALLGGLLVLLLAGAWALSSYIASDVGPVEAPVPAVDPIKRVTNPRIGRRDPEPVAVPAPQPVGAPTPTPAAPKTPDELKAMGLTPPPPTADVKPAGPNDEVPAAPDPWTDPDSRELDYAFSLLSRPDAGKEEWGKAAEVFEKCVKQAPQVAVCHEGLLKAQAMYLGQPLPPETDNPKPAPFRPGAAQRPSRLVDPEGVPAGGRPPGHLPHK
jgi:hypothetical protein